MVLKGINCDKTQGDIDFDQLKAAIDFIVIKSSSGAPQTGQTSSQFADSNFQKNRTEARRVGLTCGFYHIAYPEYNRPENEAKCFSDVVGELKEGEFMALSLDGSWGGNKSDWCLRFFETLADRYEGYKPLLFINLTTAKSGLWTTVVNAGHPLWLSLCNYDPNAPTPVTPWKTVPFRQYSSTERAPGIATTVGVSLFYGDKATLNSYGYHKPLPPPPVPIPPEVMDIKKELEAALSDIDLINGQLADKNTKNGQLSGELKSQELVISTLTVDIDSKLAEISELKVSVDELKTKSVEAIPAFELIKVGFKKLFRRR